MFQNGSPKDPVPPVCSYFYVVTLEFTLKNLESIAGATIAEYPYSQPFCPDV